VAGADRRPALLSIVLEKTQEAAALKPKSPETKALEAPPQPVLDAFHPRQRIFTILCVPRIRGNAYQS